MIIITANLTSSKSAPILYNHVGLRGVSALAVFLAHLHAYGLAGAFNLGRYERVLFWHDYAVDLFFILSGFILNWVYLPKINWKGFFSARLARILPLYFLTTLVMLPVPLYSLMRHGTDYVGDNYFWKLGENLALISGIAHGFTGTINQPAWSISIEMACYLLLFPLLALLDRWIRPWLALLTCLIFTQLSVQCHLAHPTGWDYTWLSRGICGFILGFNLCVLYRACSSWKISSQWADLGLLGLLGFCVFTRTGWINEVDILYAWPFLVLLSAFDLGISGMIGRSPVFQWLGERSYSIYLWQFPLGLAYLFLTNTMLFHQPLFAPQKAILSYLGAIIFVLGISELSYRYFELPCRKLIRGKAKPSRMASHEPHVTVMG